MEETQKITGQIEISSNAVFEIEKKIKNFSDYQKKITEHLNAPVTDLLETILAGAIILNTSDIHIEPEEKKVKLRIRIDGLLEDALFFEKNTYQALLARIKLISGIKLNIFDRPQDGRFSILWQNVSIEIRASTLPAEYGEAIVLRILNPKSLIALESLGLRQDLLKLVEKEIKKPNGMIIVAGPTGSGKTTTLYAFLNKIKKPEIKVITIEDPIEYHLEGISQTQVKSSKTYDFASGLKSIMRQDPDVILVGEIRDLETAETALQAALTGHLVLSTVHSNDAAGVISRLAALGAKTQNISPALNIVIAQRLVRKVCSKCVQLKPVSPEELKKIKSELGPLKKNLKIPKISGCKNCNHSGYKGRIGIFEIFVVDDEIKKIILKNPSIIELKEKAIKKGMTTMKQDGLLKVLQGLTTVEEIERITGE